jgi:hypothetical protein
VAPDDLARESILADDSPWPRTLVREVRRYHRGPCHHPHHHYQGGTQIITNLTTNPILCPLKVNATFMSPTAVLLDLQPAFFTGPRYVV